VHHRLGKIDFRIMFCFHVSRSGLKISSADAESRDRLPRFHLHHVHLATTGAITDMTIALAAKIRSVWPIRSRAFGSLVRGKKGKSVHDENCAKAGAFRKRNHACGRTIWIVDAHGYGKRFIVRADEKLTAFLELERAVCIHLLTEEQALKS
jgi:hypothetical protein